MKKDMVLRVLEGHLRNDIDYLFEYSDTKISISKEIVWEKSD